MPLTISDAMHAIYAADLLSATLRDWIDATDPGAMALLEARARAHVREINAALAPIMEARDD